MFIPERASSAIARHNRARNKRFVSLDEVAKDLGLSPRPRTGALDWVNDVIKAVDSPPTLVGGSAGQHAS